MKIPLRAKLSRGVKAAAQTFIAHDTIEYFFVFSHRNPAPRTRTWVTPTTLTCAGAPFWHARAVPRQPNLRMSPLVARRRRESS
eukprot:SAG11_NODE_92_length_17132_cov_10.277285_6_plen_84_part_00